MLNYCHIVTNPKLLYTRNCQIHKTSQPKSRQQPEANADKKVTRITLLIVQLVMLKQTERFLLVNIKVMKVNYENSFSFFQILHKDTVNYFFHIASFVFLFYLNNT